MPVWMGDGIDLGAGERNAVCWWRWANKEEVGVGVVRGALNERGVAIA